MTLKITIRLTDWKDDLNFKFKFNKNMPRKSDIIPINNESLDRRVKLTKEDKELVKWFREEEQVSYQKLANRFGVSKRLIMFICRPELLQKNLNTREERGGSKIYYDKNKHKEYMKDHRDYKKELYKQGKI
jgi:c-di-AMP phosphodiesterase-like protein